MALKQRDGNYFSDSQSDIPGVLIKYSQDGYLTEHFQDAICSCGHKEFRLFVDDNEGVAVRICTSCENEHPIGDSAEYLGDAELEECECPCGNGHFEITAGVALYSGSEDVKSHIPHPQSHFLVEFSGCVSRRRIAAGKLGEDSR